MFGISDFNRQVLEHPEILISVIEEEEEEENLRGYCQPYISPEEYFGEHSEGIAAVAGVFLIIGVLAAVLDFLYRFVEPFLRH